MSVSPFGLPAWAASPSSCIISSGCARPLAVKVIQFEGEEKLFYPSIPIDVAILRASYADTKGNCTFEREGAYAETLAQAQAAHNSGGAVLGGHRRHALRNADAQVGHGVGHQLHGGTAGDHLALAV